MEWRHRGSPCPQKFLVRKCTRKDLASIFWDQDSILFIDYLLKGQTIVGIDSYQCGVLIISAGAIEGHFEGKTP
jgi:hypothetical protein